MRTFLHSIVVPLMLSHALTAETHIVLSNDTSFAPDLIHVHPGDTIIWEYNTGYPHTVTSGDDCTADGMFNGSLDNWGDTFIWEVPLDAPHEIPYFCDPHCMMGMTGLIIVDDAICEHTRTDVEGPYWLPGSPKRSNLRDDGDGPLLDLNISVVNEACIPVSNAWIDIWHTDPDGEYDKEGWGYRGHHFTDASGYSLLETIVPGLYPGRTAHIHVKVQGLSSSTLTTQLYFPDVPQNDDDFFYHPDLEVIVLEEDAAGNLLAEFAFVIDDPICMGDLDQSGEVGVDDMLIVIAAYGSSDASGDANQDGLVDVSDVLLIIDGWGPCQ